MGDESVYKGLGGWLALHYRLLQGSIHRVYEKSCLSISRRLPLSVRLYVLANACAKAMKQEDISDVDRVNYAAMYRGETKGKVV